VLAIDDRRRQCHSPKATSILNTCHPQHTYSVKLSNAVIPLLLHLLQPEQALAEMVRVTKAGGWVVVLETDLGTASIDASEVDIERRLIRCLAEQQLNNGYAGRQLYRLFKRQHLLDIPVELFPQYLTAYPLARQIFLLDQVEPVALATGLITQDELHRWQTSLEQADRDGLFFASFSMVLVAGRKP
jgi:hypothetical protein